MSSQGIIAIFFPTLWYAAKQKLKTVMDSVAVDYLLQLQEPCVRVSDLELVGITI